MSDLPDRGSPDMFLVRNQQKVLEAYRLGVLKSRDEMDLEAAIAMYHAAIEAGEEPSVVAIVAAAWGVTDDAEA